jgi:hypothetical protein
MGCSKHEGKRESPPVIKFQPAVSIDMAQFIEDVRIVQLENHPYAEILDIDKVETYKDKIFLLDKRLRSVLCFDTTGRFVFRIQNTGNGKGEYRDLDAMWMNDGAEQILLHSFSLKKILAYGLDGTFQSEYLIQWGMQDIAPLRGGNLVGFSSHGGSEGDQSIEPGVYPLGRNGELIGKPKRFGGRSIYWSINYQRYLESVDGEVLVLSQSDTLWRVDNQGKITPDLIMDWGSRGLPQKLRNRDLHSPGSEHVLTGNYVFGKDMLVSFGPIRFFRIYLDKSEQFAMADLRTRCGSYSSQVISHTSSIPLLFPIGTSRDSEVIGFINKQSLRSLASMMNGDASPPDWAKRIDTSKNLLWFGKIKTQILKK